MVHVMAPKPADKRLPMFFNVDSSVGQNGANSSMDDILLIQYFLSLCGKSLQGANAEALARVPVTGRINPETIGGIALAQTMARVDPDGRVSVAGLSLRRGHLHGRPPQRHGEEALSAEMAQHRGNAGLPENARPGLPPGDGGGCELTHASRKWSRFRVKDMRKKQRTKARERI